MKPLSAEDVAALNRQLEGGTPQDVLAWGLERYHPAIALASSFGAEDMVLIDMLSRINPASRVFTLDTLRLHTETYQVVDDTRRRYNTDLAVYYPDMEAIDQMTRERGYNCFYASVEDRKRCCGIRKVEPLERALGGLAAWITGLRRDQAPTRTGVDLVEIDEVHHGMIKLNPLAAWTNDDVWAYIRDHDVPYNQLHDQGFPSIGCAPCTRRVRPDEDPRAGRWWWESDPNARECGIHVVYDTNGMPRIERG